MEHIFKNSAAQKIHTIVSNIVPFDATEKLHVDTTLDWIISGAPLFRIAKPDIPNKHLVSYFILFDPEARKVLLVDHKKALLWLPTGGHVEIDEDPRNTVIRECFEELSVEAEFLFEEPLFLTQTTTVGLTAGHTDVSLWYVLRANYQSNYSFDTSEFNQIRWFDMNAIPFGKSDMHMERFINKLQNTL